MKRTIAMLMLIVLVIGVAGCSGSFPLKWKPTEQQKQAADLAVKDIQSLAAHVTPEAQAIRAEAQQAAEVTQTYLGLPKNRPQPASPANQAVLQQAAADATRPPPTAGQVGQAVVDEASQIAASGFDMAELILTLIGGVAGTWGLGKIKRRTDEWRNTAATAEHRVGETLQALQEVVQGIDRLDPATRTVVKAAQQQTGKTQQLVAAAKRS